MESRWPIDVLTGDINVGTADIAGSEDTGIQSTRLNTIHARLSKGHEA